MAGTVEGGQSAAKTNKSKYGLDFYSRIGSKGGKVKGHGGGFSGNPEAARLAGAAGGKLSRRGPSNSPRQVKLAQKTRTKPCTYCDRPGHTSYFCEMRLQALARNKANKLRQDEITDDYAKLSKIAGKYR